jgi:hypothetical protein
MRRGEPAAWGAFVVRFRPILQAYARKARIPAWEWPICITEVLDDEAIRFSSRDVEPPVNLAAYLIRAVHHRYLRVKRSASCRDRTHGAASDDYSGEWVVSSVCSEDSIRSSAGPDANAASISDALGRLASELRSGLTTEEESILVWVSEGVPHRQIAQWLGTSYDASTKRIWRLCRRLRMYAATRTAHYSPEERFEIDRFVRRANAAAPSESREIDREGYSTDAKRRRRLAGPAR